MADTSGPPRTLRIQITTPTRLDLALLHELQQSMPALSRARLKEWFKRGEIRIAGREAAASRLLPSGTHEIEIPEAALGPLARDQVAMPAPEGTSLAVLYEDESILALHKPSGMPSVPHSADERDAAVNHALALRPELAHVGRGGLEPAILHRLDTGTSGALLFARSQEAFQRLIEAWKTPSVSKIYRAIVQAPATTEATAPATLHLGLLDLPLAHDAKSAKRMRVVRPDTPSSFFRGEPLPARTILRSVQATRLEGRLDVEVEIETGVMHQIRCHLADQGWPILGDPIYRGVPHRRLWLHAWRITLAFPDRPSITIEAPLPGDWPGIRSTNQ